MAHESGWPPNVIPWTNEVAGSEKNGSTTCGAATTAPSGAYAEVIPLARVIMSGLMP